MTSLENIRLDAVEKEALMYAFEGVSDETYMFGSRTDKNKKGGDIDLLVFSKEDPFFLSRKIAQRFFRYCEEKIDVVVFDKTRLLEEQQAFQHNMKALNLTK